MDADDNLIRMANRIGDFFEAMPDRAEALEGIATHLKKFWEPRMRRKFLALLDGNAEGMKPIVREAVVVHRGLLG
jgi:formate dehydrogenase subunit delta